MPQRSREKEGAANGCLRKHGMCLFCLEDGLQLQRAARSLVCQAMDAPDPFVAGGEVSAQAWDTLRWQSERSWFEVNAQREAITQAIEVRGHKLWKDGLRDRWHKGAEAKLAHVVSSVNGALLQELAAEARADDPGAALLLRDGQREPPFP